MKEEYGLAVLFLLSGLAFTSLIFFVNKLISEKRIADESKSTYECGEEPIGISWVQFNSRYFTMALVFILFEAEILLLFPWATSYAKAQYTALNTEWMLYNLCEVVIFIAVLGIGLAYVWAQADINWSKPTKTNLSLTDIVSKSLYEDWNRKQTK
jgi:NADH-quinone oxidoreductase subunit A